jgi:hypothetical protein
MENNDLYHDLVDKLLDACEKHSHVRSALEPIIVDAMLEKCSEHGKAIEKFGQDIEKFNDGINELVELKNRIVNRQKEMDEKHRVENKFFCNRHGGVYIRDGIHKIKFVEGEYDENDNFVPKIPICGEFEVV